MAITRRAVLGAAAGGLIATRFEPAQAATLLAGGAHRGKAYTGSAFENSALGYRQSWGTGIRLVECDSWFTKDSVPVMMHDATVDRTTNGSGRVQDMTLAQFKSLRLDDGQVPPTLDETIALMRARADRKLLLEVKHWLTATQEKILLSKLAGLEDRIELNGFSWVFGTLQRLKAANPRLRVGATGNEAILPMPTWAMAENLRQDLITAEVVAKIHAQRGKVSVGGSTEDSWRQSRSLGVDRIVTEKAYRFQQWTWAGQP